MRLAEFKKIATRTGEVYDNTEKAMQAVSKSWGLAYWRECWAYKEYRFLNMIVRTGKVYRRHGSYSYNEYLINNKVVDVNVWRTAMRKVNVA